MKWDNPYFVHKHSVDNASTKVVKTLQGEMAKPIFLEQSVHYAKFREVKWKIPFFGVQTPRGQCQRKEGCKTPQGRVDKISISSALGTFFA